MAFQYNTADPILYPLLKEFAHENKRHMTEAESMLWEFLRAGRLGARFKRQHIILGFIVDFVCLESKLVIEVDGGYHSEFEQIQKDEHRTEKIEALGYRVIRFTNEEVMEDISKVLKIIRDNI